MTRKLYFGNKCRPYLSKKKKNKGNILALRKKNVPQKDITNLDTSPREILPEVSTDNTVFSHNNLSTDTIPEHFGESSNNSNSFTIPNYTFRSITMYSKCSIVKMNQCSSCNTILKIESKLLKCLHGICNDCIMIHRSDSGVTCMICKSVTNGELIAFPNIEICNQINCCRDAVISCTKCFKEYCTLCSEGHKQSDNEHQLSSNLFQKLQRYEVTLCCTNKCNEIQKPAEVLCIQCSRTFCALCQLENHKKHGYKSLKKLNEEIVSIKDNLELNQTNINNSIIFMRTYDLELEKNYNATKAKIDKKWETILKKIRHFMDQIDIKLVKHYKEIVSEVNINKSTINKLKIENDYYLNLTLHIMNNNNYFVDIRLIKTLMNKLTEVKNYNNKVTPELNKNPDYLITNVIKSLNEMMKVIRSVEKVTLTSVLDLSTLVEIDIPPAREY